MVDALRQDHLGVYGYKRNTSPNIDNFAADALVFQRAISQSSWTSPCMTALFASKYPKGPIKKKKTLAQWLYEHSYQTCAIVANPIMIPEKGYGNGFESYSLLPWEKDSEIVSQSLEWLRSRDESKPFFLFLHLMGPHAPYEPGPPYDRRFGGQYSSKVDGNIHPYKKIMAENGNLEIPEYVLKGLIDLYDGAIACTDDQFQRLLSNLKENGIFEDTIIAIFADHGEEFMDHGGLGHGHSVFDELIRVPLIIRGLDGLNGSQYSPLFELVDLAPTLASHVGLPYDFEVDGKDFSKYLKKNKPLKKVAFSEVHRAIGLRAGNWFICARTENEKVICNPNENKYFFYDLRKDEREKVPNERMYDKSMESLRASLQYWRKVNGEKGFRMEVDDKTLKALRSLGYIH